MKRLPRFCLCPMWSPSLRAPPLLAGACFLSFVSAFGLPPRRRRFAPPPVGGCVLPVLFRGCRLRRRCPFSLVRPPLWRRCSALCVRAFSVPHATSRAIRCAALAARAPLSLPQSELGAAHSAFAPCERREVYGFPKQFFEVNAPQGGAGFPVLESPPLFAPLALTRCSWLARSLCRRRRWSGEARKRARFRPSRLCQAQPHHYERKQKAASLSRSSRPWGGCFANLDSLPFFANG